MAGIDALVLAGHCDPDHPVARADGVSARPFARVGGVPMVERVVATLRASEAVGQVTVSLTADAPTAREAPALAAAFATGDVLRADPGGSRAASVLSAMTVHDDGRPLLITTADHALLTPAIVSAFLAGAAGADADVAVGLAPVAAIERAYPDVRRTRLVFRDGAYSACNLFLLRRPEARRVVAFWQTLETHRKSPRAIAARVGPDMVLGYLLRRWTLAQALSRLGSRIAASLVPVVLDTPEAAIDVDTPEHLGLARQIAAARAAAAQDPVAS